ncbi:hydrogenase-4 component B [Clostridium tepidiprofundi DSM 19306]|uniref:Hydrogenase-4 component B n=1 Tax=Clostridium tepidiprofundi DSM 19306 TaxID=1121338 RepID=A0A151B6S1_9CLOT|nr:proton-conducting transporter membrane subunit [Clostridium tepidiprofundi]KYH35641.1 hydrogenase-4 component B [Clostridium tepidiprofundi DSM 19306]
MNGYSSILPLMAIMLPFLAAFIIALTGNKALGLKRALAVIFTFIPLLAVILLFKPIMADGHVVSYWLGNWVPEKTWAIGIGLEIDAFGLFCGLIITLTCFLSSIFSIRYMEKDNGLEKYYTMFMLLTASMIGFVFTGDLFNMYVMLEIMTFAAIGLTAFRNHKYKAIEAGFKYIVIGSVGSSLILLGTVLIYAQAHTLNIAQISAILHGNYNAVTIFALALMLTGYAVKAFLVPCHTWPADAHMSAPSSISMLLSGVMSKTGVFGIIRILYMIYRSKCVAAPSMEFLIIFWGTITMLIGASMAIIQTDFKRLLAFSSVSQIGYVIVGFGVGLSAKTSVAVTGTMGGLYHMLNHAMFKSLAFLCAGAVLYRTGTTDTTKLGGLAKKMPYTTVLFMISLASIAGVPPFNGFVSKWLIYQSTFEAGYWPVTIIALLVSVMTLAYFIKLAQSVFFGKIHKEHENIKEIPWSMRAPMIVLAGVCIFAGTFWNVISDKLIEPAAYAIYNIQGYIDVMFNKGYAQKMFNQEIPIPKMTRAMAGYWSPINWLLLFVVLIVGFIVIASLLAKGNKNEPIIDLSDTKYDTFTGGEKEDFSHMAGNDLFWGLKHQFRGYFEILKNAHSGIVNDYVLWVAACAAVVTIYLFAVL